MQRRDVPKAYTFDAEKAFPVQKTPLILLLDIRLRDQVSFTEMIFTGQAFAANSAFAVKAWSCDFKVKKPLASRDCNSTDLPSFLDILNSSGAISTQ